MEKKILFLDLDGTLLNDKKEITEENMTAIQKAIDMGHAVVVATGRPKGGITGQIKAMKLDRPGCYAIAANGATVFNTYTGEIIYENGVSREYLRYAFDEAHRFGLHAQTYAPDAILTEYDNDEIKYYSGLIKMPYRVVDDISTAIDYDPIKMLFIHLDDRKKLEDFQEHIRPWYEERQLEVFFSCDRHLECLPHGVSKGSGIRFLCEYLQIPFENTLAAGDAENDISMLEAVAIPCVMKNARPEMYPYGKYITERDNNQSGVAEIIEKFMLEA